MKLLVVLTLLFTGVVKLYAQTKSNNNKTLSLEQFHEWVLKFHPLAKQSDLILDMAAAELTRVKGNFDPKLFYDLNAKTFNDKLYYQYSNGGVKWSSPAALEFKTGYENNTGIYLNEESILPNNGLVYSQISLPLLQGLLIDERRAALSQAKIFNQLSLVEKQQMINELLLKSGKAYLDWQLAFQNYLVYEMAYNISNERYEGIVQTVYLGDRPAIDTVEAKIQLQDRWLNCQQARLELQNKRWLLSGFLWSENNEPVVLNDSIIPATTVDLEQAEALIVRYDAEKEIWAGNHPFVNVYQFKNRQLEVDKRLKKDKLKPVLNLNYNPLFTASQLSNASLNNYKWGLTAAFPLLLRKERGALQQANIKLEQNRLEWNYKKNEQLNKIRNEFQSFVSFKNQQSVYKENVERYEVLWKAEKNLFESGESSLFMINNRELSYISAQLKQNELVNKLYKSALEFQVACGQFTR